MTRFDDMGKVVDNDLPDFDEISIRNGNEYAMIDLGVGTFEYMEDVNCEESYLSGCFSLDENKVVDYDGCFELPRAVANLFVLIGYDISELMLD